MCNRFINTATKADIQALCAALSRPLRMEDATLGGPVEMFPDRDVPVLGQNLKTGPDGELICKRLRWGLPPIPGGKSLITNIRNLKSRWWAEENHALLIRSHFRCLVPFTRFAEPARNSSWFETDVAVPCFAGIWQPWHGERLADVGGPRRVRQVGDWRLFAFLTTDANAMVAPVHPKAMPVILADPADQAAWLAGGEASLALQRPFPAERMCLVGQDAPMRENVPTGRSQQGNLGL